MTIPSDQIKIWIASFVFFIGFTLKNSAADTNFPGNEDSIIVGKTGLPKQVPYLNKLENYIIGNGIICASGTGDGQWDFIAGPDYTCPNLIKNEKLAIIINGTEHELNLSMFRARETGVFYGFTSIDGMHVTLLDYTVPDLPIVSRLVFVRNTTNKNQLVRLKAKVTPFVVKGITDMVVKNKNGIPSACLFQVDTTLFCMYSHTSNWVKNWENRLLLTSWSEGKSVTQKDSGVYQIVSVEKNISGYSLANFNLCHYAFYPHKATEDYLADIESRKGIDDAEQCIHMWQRWYRNVAADYSLEKITDPRARDIIEGGLYIIKTNQTNKGGLVANERYYNLSWTRDAYCGLRGLLACGHTEESKQFLLFMNEIYHAYGFIPNAVSCGSNTFALYNGNHLNNKNRHLGQFSPCPEANSAPETPALLLLAARDYYRATNDINTIKEVESSLKYAMDIQLKHAMANNYKLEFSGDETELCGAVNTSSAGYDNHLEKYWSMSSIALCIASLEFYTEYFNLNKTNTIHYKNSLNGEMLNLNVELDKLKTAFETDFWRTDLKNFPSGVYDWCRLKANNDFPQGRIVNFSLFPLYYKMKSNYPDRLAGNVKSVKRYFNQSNILPLVPDVGGQSYLGHNLGYLLWNLIEVGDDFKDKVYETLVNGNSAQCWGSFNEAYDAEGKPNNNNLRTFETGVNVDAIAKYWDLGQKSKK